MGIRFDCVELRLDEAIVTPSGARRIPARIARTGVQSYSTHSGGSRVEYRPPAEVFSEDSLASFRGVAVSIGHPTKPVTPASWSSVAVGHIADDVRQDGDYVAASVVISDDRAIKRIDSGELLEISAGYTQLLVESPGTTPDGERYDAIQTKIKGNHLALLPPGHGRAGPEVRLRLDAHDDQIGEEPVMTETTDRREDGGAGREDAAIRIDELHGRCDALEAENAKLVAELAAATSAEAIQARVDARVELIAAARKIKPDVDTSGSDREIMLSVLSDVRQDASDDYLRGMMVATAAMTQTQQSKNSHWATQPQPEKNRLDEAEEQYMTRIRALSAGRTS